MLLVLMKFCHCLNGYKIISLLDVTEVYNSSRTAENSNVTVYELLKLHVALHGKLQCSPDW